MAKVRIKAPLVCYIVLFAVLFALYLPLVHMITGAFVVDQQFTLHWFKLIVNDSDLLAALQRSLVLAFANGLVSVVLGVLIAFALARSKFRIKWLLQFFSLVSIGIPELVFALSLLSWFFILKWQLSLLTVLVAHATFSLSFVALTIYSQLLQIEPVIEEAAQDLGASPWQVALRITFPILRPALLAGFFLGFLLSFDDFLITFFTTGVGYDTLPVKLYSSLRLGSSPKLNALASLMILLSSVVLFLFSRTLKKLKS